VQKFLLPLFLLALFPPVAGAVAVYWDGTAGDGDWTNSGNWSSDPLAHLPVTPASGDDLVIPAGIVLPARYPNPIPSLVVQAGSSAWGSLTLGSGVTLEVGTVTIKTGTTFDLRGDGVFKAGTVTAGYDTANPVDLIISDNVTLECTGDITINNNVELNLSFSGSADAEVTGGITIGNAAALKFNYAAGYTGAGTNAASITIGPGGTLNIDGADLNIGSGGLTGAITSSGGGIVTTGDLTQTGGGISGDVTITADGSGGIDLSRGNTLTSANLTATSGNIILENDATGVGGTLSFTANAVAAGKTIAVTESGNLEVTAGGIAADGGITLNGNVTIPPGSTVTLDSLTAKTVSITGNMELYGTLNAGSSPGSGITITVGGNWIQTGAFNPQVGTVEFSNTAVTINGNNTTWYDLEFQAGATVEFSNYPASNYSTVGGHHIRNKIKGAPARLTRATTVSGTLPVQEDYPALGNGHADKFWNLYYDPNKNGVFDDLENTELEWCWVRPAVSKTIKTPRVSGWGVPDYNVGWKVSCLVYSFTEDWDHNGRIDHIRVQSSAPVNMDFTGFSVNVTGYTVKGFSGAAPSPPPDISGYLFFIELEERDYPDTGETPSWEIRGSGNFRAGDGSSFVLLDAAKKPIDTAPPQVVYALALPGGNEIFVRLSEPVEFDIGFNAAASIRVKNTPGAYALVPVTTVSGKPLEFMITGVDPSVLTAADIARGINFEFEKIISPVPGHFHDSPAGFSYPPEAGGQTVGSYLLWPRDRKYEYGGNGAAAYEDRAPAWTGGDPVINLDKPNYNWNNDTAFDYVHRVSDALVARQPAGAAAPFFALPVYAHDVNGEGGANARSRIFEFEGGKALLYSDLTIQAKINDAVAPGLGGLELYYAQDRRIPAEYRSAAARHGTEGLWLPAPPAAPPFKGISGLTPRYYAANRAVGRPQGGNLYHFGIPVSTLLPEGTLEFYFRLVGAGPGSDLFVARLDEASALPWYRRIKPFAIQITDLPRQRGGVTIFNNVINPVRGDSVMVSCILDTGGRITAQVFSMDGTLIKTLVNGVRGAGNVTLSWDGKNAGGRAVARGLYFIRVVAPDIDEIRKVMVVR
jgi:hypothetical protein